MWAKTAPGGSREPRQAECSHSGTRWQFFSSTAGSVQTLWDFCLRESKQGFWSVEELSGAVYKGDQSGLLLITCLLTAIKPSLHIQSHKSPYECSTLYLIFILSSCICQKHFAGVLGGQMKTSWMQGEAAGCIHLPFQDPTKLVTGFCHCSVLGVMHHFHWIGTEREQGGEEGKERRKKSKTSFFPTRSQLIQPLNVVG